MSGRISKVMYRRIPNEVCSVEKISEFYFNQNTLGLNEQMDKEAEAYEIEQFKLRGKLFKEYSDSHPGEHPKVQTALFGISTMNNCGILIAKL